MADSSAVHPSDDLSTSTAISCMVGVYLAVNAVRDLFLLVEGPDCTYMKTQYVQGNHDWLSTLTSVSGTHRVANTALHPSHLSASREATIRDLMLKMASHNEVPALALTSMPMSFITGADYERLLRDVTAATGKPTFHIPGKSLSGDWLDGYAEALHALAAQLDLTGAKPTAGKVAVVGLLFDRNEDDHTANVREIKRMLGAVGLEACSVWLSGGSLEELREARFASTILALPYGRRAANKLGRRLGVPVLEVPLPFGFDATEAFLRHAGALAGCEQQAAAFIDQELSRVVPRLEWVIPFLFQNRTVGFVGEPGVLPGIHAIVTMLGATLKFAVLTNRPIHAKDLAFPGTDLLVHPRVKSLARYLRNVDDQGGVDLLIANNVGIIGTKGAVFEFGFPSYVQHALYERPFLGFPGAMAFIDSLANALRMQELHTFAQGRNPAQRSVSEVVR